MDSKWSEWVAMQSTTYVEVVRHGADLRTLVRRAEHGGRKGRRAARRLQRGEYSVPWAAQMTVWTSTKSAP